MSILRNNQVRKTIFKIVSVGVIFMFVSSFAYCLPLSTETSRGGVVINYVDFSILSIGDFNEYIVNFFTFKIGEQKTIIVNFPEYYSKMLSMIASDRVNKLLGNFQNNSIFILVNEAGIFVRSSSNNIDLGGFVLSTHDNANNNFLSQSYALNKDLQKVSDFLLINQVESVINESGLGLLIADSIEKEGVVFVSLRKSTLGLDNVVIFDIFTEGLISVAIDQSQVSKMLDAEGKPVTDQIKNNGLTKRDKGIVAFNQEGLSNVFEKSINCEGLISANGVENSNGIIMLVSSEAKGLNKFSEAEEDKRRDEENK